MRKAVLAILLVANLAIFAYLRWGSALTQEGTSLLPLLNAEQVKLLGLSAPALSPASHVPPAGEPPAAASAPLAASAPAATQPPVADAPASAVKTADNPPRNAPKNTAACTEWGEFSGSDLADASNRLSALKLGPKLTKREVEHTIGYWVYIPPPKDAAQLEGKIAQLKKQGIADFFVVQEKGKWQNAVSLNVFKTEDQARKFLDHLKSKGIKDATLGERQTHLKFTVFILKHPDTATLEKLASWQKGYTAIEIKSVPCK